MSIPEEFSFDNLPDRTVVRAGEGEVLPDGWQGALRRYFLTALIILIALLAFGIGRLTGSDREGVKIITNDQSSITNQDSLVVGDSEVGDSAQSVSASSQGTKYYFSHCGNNISEKNRVTFATAALAEEAGYTLAKNCQPK